MRRTPSPPFQNRTANAGRSRFYARRGGKGSEQITFRPHDAGLFGGDLDALGERPEMVAAVASPVDLHPLAACPSELADDLRRDCLLA